MAQEIAARPFARQGITVIRRLWREQVFLPRLPATGTADGLEVIHCRIEVEAFVKNLLFERCTASAR